jgi:hypothetical protein
MMETSTMRWVVAIAACIALAAASQAVGAPRCPVASMQYCSGSWGPGGCYAPGYAECRNGIVCVAQTTVCPPGPWGRGGCYAPIRAQCRNGMICSAGLTVCGPGRKGGGGCYNPAARRCDNGRIY